MTKKRFFKLFILPWFKWLARVFYQKKYLIGRHFEREPYGGWLWVLIGIWQQKILGFNRAVPFPCHFTARIYQHQNIFFHPDNLDNFQSPGIYFDSVRPSIYLAKGVLIGLGVKLLTSNHDVNDFDLYQPDKDIVIGKNCWLGADVILLPGVTLNHTIVGAGTMVAHSFEKGNCVLAGVPAKLIKRL